MDSYILGFIGLFLFLIIIILIILWFKYNSDNSSDNTDNNNSSTYLPIPPPTLQYERTVDVPRRNPDLYDPSRGASAAETINKFDDYIL